MDRSRHLPLDIWFIMRILVPLGPLLIENALGFLGAYTPIFPQPTFIMMIFTLAMVTTTEYRNLRLIIFLSIAPAITGTFLYTVYLIVEDPMVKQRTLMAGFYIWIFLVAVHFVRVAIEFLVFYFQRNK